MYGWLDSVGVGLRDGGGDQVRQPRPRARLHARCRSSPLTGRPCYGRVAERPLSPRTFAHSSSATFSKASKRRVHSLSAGQRRPGDGAYWLYLPRLMIEEITEAQG
jgi:hypothetical protein